MYILYSRKFVFPLTLNLCFFFFGCHDTNIICFTSWFPSRLDVHLFLFYPAFRCPLGNSCQGLYVRPPESSQSLRASVSSSRAVWQGQTQPVTRDRTFDRGCFFMCPSVYIGGSLYAFSCFTPKPAPQMKSLVPLYWPCCQVLNIDKNTLCAHTHAHTRTHTPTGSTSWIWDCLSLLISHLPFS